MNLYRELRSGCAASSCILTKYASIISFDAVSRVLPVLSKSLHSGWMLSWSSGLVSRSLSRSPCSTSRSTIFFLKSSPMNSTLPSVRFRSFLSLRSLSSAERFPKLSLSGSFPINSNSDRHLPISTSEKGSTPSSSSSSGRSCISVQARLAGMMPHHRVEEAKCAHEMHQLVRWPSFSPKLCCAFCCACWCSIEHVRS